MATKIDCSPSVTRRGALDMQVCVPASWEDKEVLNFAESNNPCGTTNGWFIYDEWNKQKEREKNVDGVA